MAHLIFHAGTEGKATRSNVKGMVRHTQRKTLGAYKNHGNKDINPQLTQYNLEGLVDGKTIDEMIEERLANEYKGKRALRKDQVVLREIIASPSPDVFEGMTIEEKRDKLGQFIKDSLPWFAKEFGGENVVGLSGHLDETNPHVHFAIMPMTKDGRVSQTEFFKNPNDLKRMHREFRQHMIDKGWDFQLENKNEDFDYVDLPTLKKHGSKLKEKREEHKRLAQALAIQPDIRKDAIEIAYNDVHSRVLRKEEEDLKKRKKKLEQRENELKKREQSFKGLKDGMEAIFLEVSKYSNTHVDRKIRAVVVEKGLEGGIETYGSKELLKAMEFSIRDAVSNEKDRRLQSDIALTTLRKKTQREKEPVPPQPEIVDDGPEL